MLTPLLSQRKTSGVDTKYEHQVGQATKQKQREFRMWMFSSEILLVSRLYNVICREIENSFERMNSSHALQRSGEVIVG